MKLPGKISKKHLVIFLILGIFLVYLSDFAFRKIPEKAVQTEALASPQDTSEQNLKRIIESLEGISDVSVFVSYDNKGQKAIAMQGEESSATDGSKTSVTKKRQVVTERSSSGELPFVTEEKMPDIRGVIIAAKGVNDKEKNAMITQAVSAALGVPIHRVKVLSKD